MSHAEQIPIYHKTCGNIAFYSIGRFVKGDKIKFSRIILLNGECPKPFDQMVCGSCGKKCNPSSLEYR